MEKYGPDFYDEAGVFETYSELRGNPQSANETIEQPILWEMIGNPAGFDVLDLGCGNARVARKFKALGAKSYVGVDGSKRMHELACGNVDAGFSTAILSWLEEYRPPEAAFDVVVSSLALHYIADFPALAATVARSLRPGGRFIFSVEHPVITSCNQALAGTDVRQAWIVDEYFERGPRRVEWMGDTVTKYHRTIEDYLNAVSAVGFGLERLRESDPPRPLFADEKLWRRRRRIPLFLFLAAKKPTASS